MVWFFDKVKALICGVLNTSRCTLRAMSPHRILNGVLGALLCYNIAFFVFHLTDQARAWRDALEGVQSLLNIFELIAVASLFVDLVRRFDEISAKWQTPRVAAVGLCVAGMLFKWFILYLQLSYLVD